MITCEDWRVAPAAVVGELFDAECARWEADLGWNYRPACRLLELARTKGHLPGLLARADCGRVVGWVYFLLQERTLQIGNLMAADPAVATALLDGALCATEARPALRVRSFLYPVVPAIESVLAQRGFTVDRHTYMRRPLAQHSTRSAAAARRVAATESRPVGANRGTYVIDSWSPRLIPDVVQLLAQAYAGMPQARCFAPDGRVDQWTNYVGQLVQTPACGRFEHRLSAVARTAAGELAGIVLATALGDRTAHIAQMAVAARHRGHGVGERLVHAVCERAADVRFERMTLLVADSNAAARRLYARGGFEDAATFLFADQDLAPRSESPVLVR